MSSSTLDWDSYYAMRDSEVVVICKRCHYAWTKFGVKPGDPGTKCFACGGFKAPQFNLCFPCQEKVRTAAKEHRAWPNPFRYPRPPWRQFLSVPCSSLALPVALLDESNFFREPDTGLAQNDMERNRVLGRAWWRRRSPF